MRRIEVSRVIDQPPETVWGALSDLENHVLWMKDAERIEFVTDQTRGTGTMMEVMTVVGPLRTMDVLEVTNWQEGSHIDVVHSGVVKGSGRLALAHNPQGTLVTWTEEIHFPWWLGGPVTGYLARPILRRVWTGNLQRLEQVINSP